MALMTYWIIFIIIPVSVTPYLIGFNTLGFGASFILACILTIIGERVFRKWNMFFTTESNVSLPTTEFNCLNITKIIAYKIDLGTEDEIRFDIYRSNGSIDVHTEEDPNFNSVIKALELAYPTFDRQWHSKVSQPAFKTCETVILNNA